MAKRVRTEFSQNKQSVRHNEQIESLTKDSILSVKDEDISLHKHRPSWRLDRHDPEKWCIREAIKDDEGIIQNDLIDALFDKLRSFEQQTWGQILNCHGNPNHTVTIGQLNDCAKQRLRELKLDADIEKIVSLRFQSRVRLYGYFKDGSALNILWYDTDHGDNDTCVVRSRKKHT